MNELTTPGLSQLPSLPVEDVKQTVDKVGAYVDALAAAKRAATDQSTIDEIDEQIRKYSAFKMRCQMELGERTANMEKNKEFHGNQYFGESRLSGDTKKAQLEELGISSQRASEYEQLVKPENRPIVERYIEDTEEAEEIPTISGALREIKEAKKPHVTNNSKDDEWYTPEQYIEAARLVMGSIDLDPASNEFANEVVRADTYFDEETDGLMQEWFGNIWLNPPYSTALVKDFTEKLTNSEFEQAIVLVNNATETAWFRKMIDNASAVVFTTGRIKFRKRDGEHGTPLQGQAFIYFGDNENNCFIFFELKRDGDPPTGQGSALRSLVDAIDKGGAESVLLIAHHDEESENTIVAKDSIVDQIYWRGRMVPGSGKTLGTVIDEYIEFLEEEERRKNEARRASKEAHQKYIRYALGGGNVT